VTGSGRARMSARSEAVIDEGEESARVHRSWRGKEGGGAAEVMVCGVGYLRVWEVEDLFVGRGRWWGTCCGMEDGEKETEEMK